MFQFSLNFGKLPPCFQRNVSKVPAKFQQKLGKMSADVDGPSAKFWFRLNVGTISAISEKFWRISAQIRFRKKISKVSTSSQQGFGNLLANFWQNFGKLLATFGFTHGFGIFSALPNRVSPKPRQTFSDISANFRQGFNLGGVSIIFR